MQQETSPSHTNHHELTIKTPRLRTGILKNPQQKHPSTTSKKIVIRPENSERIMPSFSNDLTTPQILKAREHL
jgi:hypothetical protein